MLANAFWKLYFYWVERAKESISSLIDTRQAVALRNRATIFRKSLETLKLSSNVSKP